MRTFLLGLAAAVCLCPSAEAQTVQLPRADVHFVVGWQNIHKEQPFDSYNDWLNDIFYGGAGAGWFWTENLKTQVDIGAGTKGSQSRYRQFTVNGNPAYETARVETRQTSVAIAQQYQFFRNQWFHPRIAAGVDLARETTIEEYQPVSVYDPVLRVTRTVQPGRTEGPEHRFVARPFAEGGFKAYVTPRAFFTGDMRMMFRHGIDEVLFRAGFGLDF
jgi:hypothetical protein